MSQDALLRMKAIDKAFGSAASANYRMVLDGLDLELAEGESMAVLGPSGSGKTTLLNLVGGLDYPDSGSIVFRGREISSYAEAEMDRFRNREIGFVFQFHHLLPQCSLLENVLVPTLLDKAGRKEHLDRAEKLMRRVGIWEFRDKLPGKLSGGECQRAAVVRAMINSPSLLLADEPTGALDRDNVDTLGSLLLELNKEDGLTLLVVTHSEQLASRMSRKLVLDKGRLR